MFKILVIDDEDRIRMIIRDFLEADNFSVDEASDGKIALELVSHIKYDVIILDIMMPNMNGIETCMRIRKISNVPIIMLTAKNEEDDYMEGFRAGTDDYITKPFSNKVLVEKVKAMLRRVGKKDKRYDFGELKLDINSMKAYFEGNELPLTATEYDLLFYLVENENIALSRDQIINKVWGYNYFGEPRTIDTHIKNLRKKLNDRYIETVRGHGYRFEVRK